jgi:hypothetical protein
MRNRSSYLGQRLLLKASSNLGRREYLIMATSPNQNSSRLASIFLPAREADLSVS